MLVYLWSRRNPDIRINFLGLAIVTAPYLPWIILVFNFLLTNRVQKSDLFGIAVGHVYYFLKDIYPNGSGHDPLSTPSFLYNLRQV